MTSYSFKAHALFKEINLNTIAAHFGINKEFKWEDFLRLQADQLSGIISNPVGKRINLFPYGSVVFMNMEQQEITEVVNYLLKIDPKLSTPDYTYQDEYSLQLTSETESVTNDAMLVHEITFYHLEILSTVLAKSVALENVESDIEVLLDEVESVIDKLQNGILNYRDDTLARTSARILRFKYKTLSTIMLLDKPDITWNNEGAEVLHNDISHLFELGDRYDRLQAKSRTLIDILDVFSTLTQQRRANNLDWLIIILILISIIISLIDFYYKLA